MSCKNCAEAYEIDHQEPDCWTETGCRILIPDAWGQRILEIRQQLITLKDLVDPGTILRLYGVDVEDLELLAAVEAELKLLSKENKGGAEEQ